MPIKLSFSKIAQKQKWLSESKIPTNFQTIFFPFIDKTKVQINKLISNSMFIIFAKSGSVCCLWIFFSLSLMKERLGSVMVNSYYNINIKNSAPWYLTIL